jgi:hypothetical protein
MRVTLVLIAIIVLFTSCSRTIEDAKENYLEKAEQINLVSDYVCKISPKNLNLFIRFTEDEKIAITLSQKNYEDKASWVKNSLFDKYGAFHSDEQPINSPKVLAFLQFMNWEQTRLDTLHTLLQDANCDSIGKFAKDGIAENEYVSIGYPTNDFYGLTYQVYNAALSEQNQKTFLDKCNIDLVNEKVLIEYGGPAWGSDCIPEKR